MTQEKLIDGLEEVITEFLRDKTKGNISNELIKYPNGFEVSGILQDYPVLEINVFVKVEKARFKIRGCCIE